MTSSTTVAAPASPADCAPDEVQQLAAQLAEKEVLVAALTEQLERAAEELDRLQRSGADRRRTGLLSADVAQDQRQLIGELQRVVQQWDDLQAGLTLGRIEVQLTELREFLAARLDGSRPLPQVESSESFAVVEEPCAPHGANGSETSEWDRIKSQLLEPGDGAVRSAPPVVEEPLPEPPATIDPVTADRVSLVAAVESRDDYIAHLLRRLRQREAYSTPTDWTALAQHDPDLTTHLQNLAQQLEEKLRLAEVELSLERARIAREHGELLHQQELLAKQLKRLGFNSVEMADAAAPTTETHRERRWIRFLGRNHSRGD